MKIPLFGDSMSMDTTSIKDTTTTTTSSADIQRNQSKQCPPFVPLLFSTPTATTTKTANAANLLDVLSCHQENVALSWQELVSSNNNNNLLIIMPVIMAVLLSLMTVFFTILCIGRRYLHRHRHHPKRGNYTSTKPRRQIKRTVSFTSSMMAAKVIAPHANLPEPVINAVVLFETCPTPNDVLQLVVKKMLEYERLSQIPTIDTNHKNGEQLSFQPGTNYDPAKLIRTMQVKDKDDSELYKMIENHIHDPLNDTQGRGRLPWWEILVIEVRKPNVLIHC